MITMHKGRMVRWAFLLLILFSLVTWGSGEIMVLLPIITVFIFRMHKPWPAFFVSAPIFWLGTTIGQQGFIPYPPSVLVMISLLLTLVYLLPFLIDRVVYRKLPVVLQLLLLPALANIFNLYLSQGPTGAMGYIANHLTGQLWLMQWTAFVGIFGIGFLMYLLATTCFIIWENRFHMPMLRNIVSIVIIAFIILSVGGHIRLHSISDTMQSVPKTKIAAITDESMPISEALFEAHYDSAVSIPKDMNQSDPVNAMVGKAMMDFKDNSHKPKYEAVWLAIDHHFEKILASAETAVSDGAKIIVLSEAELISTKAREARYITKLTNFAQLHEVYFFAGIGTLIPHKKFPPDPVVENKILVISPRGQLLDTYFKNVPVPDIDPSVPGNGKMRAIDSPFGKIAYAICYDTDFPDLMQQVGRLKADLLVVPAGDWKAISPYHTHATNIRSIENGFAQVRAVSGGLSSMVDASGKYYASDDYFDDDQHILISAVPLISLNTFYTQYGNWIDWFTYSIALTSIIALFREKYF